MIETERVRGGDVVGGRLSHMTSVYVFSPDRGGAAPISTQSPVRGAVDHTFRFGDRHSRYQSAQQVPECDDRHSRYQLTQQVPECDDRQRKRWSPNPRVWKKIPLYVESMEDDHP